MELHPNFDLSWAPLLSDEPLLLQVMAYMPIWMNNQINGIHEGNLLLLIMRPSFKYVAKGPHSRT